MPEGNFFADPKDITRTRVGAAGDGRRGARGVPPGAVPEGVRTQEFPGRGAASVAVQMPTTLPELLQTVRRRFRLIAGTVVLVTTVGATVMSQMTTLYTAEAVVVLDTRDVQVVDIKAVVPSRPFNATMVRDEMEVLRSHTLAASVVKKLHLTEQPEFAGLATPTQGQGDAARRLQRAIGALLDRLTIQNDGRSFVLKIEIAARNPQLAANIANAYAELYLEHQIATKEEATRHATEWLKQQIAELRDQIANDEDRIGRYKEDHGISSARGTTVTAQELADINAQLIAAHSDRVQKEAAFHYARQVLGSPDGAEAAGQVLASPLIQRLREQEADLLRGLAEMSTRYRPAHPTMVRMKAELDDLRRKIADEANRMVRVMADEVNAARTREDALKANLAQLSISTARQEGAQIQLRELEREADASRALYESLLARFKQISTQQDILQSDAQIISRAEPPLHPSWPDRRRLLESCVGLSLFAGIALSVFIEFLDTSFRRPEEIEDLAGLPVLGLLPTMRRNRPGVKTAESRETVLSEALRGIRSGVRHSQAGAPLGVVLVTSAVEGEGKTFFAVALGRSVTRARMRCLLIDCHFQRPGVDKLLSPAPAQNAPARPAYPQLQVDKHSGLHYIAAPSAEQRVLFRSQDLFESAEMRNYILRMRGHYDLIILDAPPTPAAADVVALSRLADTAIFLVRWGRTPRQVALRALHLLAVRGVNATGVVLSRVDLRRYAAYGYAEYVRYLENAPGEARRR